MCEVEGKGDTSKVEKDRFGEEPLNRRQVRDQPDYHHGADAVPEEEDSGICGWCASLKDGKRPDVPDICGRDAEDPQADYESVEHKPAE